MGEAGLHFEDPQHQGTLAIGGYRELGAVIIRPADAGSARPRYGRPLLLSPQRTILQPRPFPRRAEVPSMKPFAVVHRSSRTFLAALTALLALAATGTVAPALAQEPLTNFKRPPVQTRQFGDLAEGPYNRLVIQNVNVLPGSTTF